MGRPTRARGDAHRLTSRGAGAQKLPAWPAARGRGAGVEAGAGGHADLSRCNPRVRSRDLSRRPPPGGWPHPRCCATARLARINVSLSRRESGRAPAEAARGARGRQVITRPRGLIHARRLPPTSQANPFTNPRRDPRQELRARLSRLFAPAGDRRPLPALGLEFQPVRSRSGRRFSMSRAQRSTTRTVGVVLTAAVLALAGIPLVAPPAAAIGVIIPPG